MATTTRGRRLRGAAAKRRMAARKKMYMRRRMVALCITLAVATGTYYGLDWVLSRLFGEPAELSFSAERYVATVDLTGDNKPEELAIGKAEGTTRQVLLVTGGSRKPIGKSIEVPASYDLQLKDLERTKSVLVLTGSLNSTGTPKQVKVGNQPAVEATGGEPDFLAWRLDKTKGLTQVDYYQLMAPANPPAPTMILVDKWLNVLWYYESGELIQTARVATGRHIEGPAPSFANQDQNFITPTGRYSIINKVENPPYYRLKIPGGDPQNPLGPRWLGFSVFDGDRGMVWGIHGTDEPEQIGRWVSDGCIRLTNDEVRTLYDRVKEGTVLEIRSSKPTS